MMKIEWVHEQGQSRGDYAELTAWVTWDNDGGAIEIERNLYTYADGPDTKSVYSQTFDLASPDALRDEAELLMRAFTAAEHIYDFQTRGDLPKDSDEWFYIETAHVLLSGNEVAQLTRAERRCLVIISDLLARTAHER